MPLFSSATSTPVVPGCPGGGIRTMRLSRTVALAADSVDLFSKVPVLREIAGHSASDARAVSISFSVDDEGRALEEACAAMVGMQMRRFTTVDVAGREPDRL